MVYLEATINMRVTPVQVVVVRNLSPFQIMLMSLLMSCNRLLSLQWRRDGKFSNTLHNLHITKSKPATEPEG